MPKMTQNNRLQLVRCFSWTDMYKLTYAQPDVYKFPFTQLDVYKFPFTQTDVCELNFAEADMYELPNAKADIYKLLFAKSDVYELPRNQMIVVQPSVKVSKEDGGTREKSEAATDIFNHHSTVVHSTVMLILFI